MKKQHKIVCLTTAAVLALSCGSVFVGCKNNETGDPEKRPFVMSIQQPDGVFNPFFSTSQYDSNIWSWTQLSMFSTDKSGQLVAGEDQSCVVKAYASKFDANEDNGMDDDGVTTYQLALKNGIKFSDGEPLTIKDVLFNLYIYLDPAYTGSSTIYSTKFVGLEDYRTNQYGASEGFMSTFEQGFVDDAQDRIDNLANYVNDHSANTSSLDKTGINWETAKNEETGRLLAEYALEDYVLVRELFLEELTTDWNSTEADFESYKDWGFEEPWQVYWLNDGQMSDLLQKDAQGNFVKDEQTKNYLFDKDGDAVKGLEEDLAFYIQDQKDNGSTKSEAELTKEWAINSIYEGYFNPRYTTVASQIEHIVVDQFKSIIRAWATADELRTKLTAKAKQEYFDSVERVVPNVAGITAIKGDTLLDGTKLGEECDILQVKIRGIDPKALWNLAFNVAPMHYYSGVFKGTDYREEYNGYDNFGLPVGNVDFMTEVVNAPSKVGLPVGAGPYMASSRDEKAATNGSEFWNLGVIYYERNPYFETVGKEISNAKIKYMQYRVVTQDQIINNLASGAIDYGEPNATQRNISDLNGRGIAHEEYRTGGYGYIGINPRFVPDITVRRAIMKAFDTSTIFNNYYQGGLAEPIYRPMSLENWAYPDGAQVYVAQDGTSYKFDATGTEIEKMLADAGYTKVNGVLQKDLGGSIGIHKLEYTFTIAGGTTDHPAYNVFLDARDLLNKLGFKIKVVQSAQALSDLTTGKLQVWAAAWSSAVDPDMYQIYHKDSNATSVNNWGYPYMRADQTTYSYEWRIVGQLSTLIDEGRETDVQAERKDIYKDALDLVMELAVEYPTYQRNDMYGYSAVLDRKTMPAKEDCGAYYGLLSRIWEINYNT